TTAVILIIASELGCTGEILLPQHKVPPGTDPNAPATYEPSFICPAAPALAATPIKRLAKVELVNSIGDFFSELSDSDRAALIASVQPQIDLVPEDSSAYSYRGDALVTQN